ncbi:MAG TPA: hypothetical protein VGB53_08365 [Rubricoccaceae bacterium]|jgi:hypothetical protein
MPSPTHQTLVKKAVAFLRYKASCVLFVPECGVTSECPDAVGWTAHGECVVVECKASRADFFADRKKPHRAPGAGVGHTRYFLVPDGLVKADEVPEGWGLLALSGRSVFTVVRAERRHDHDERTNATLLLHLARRACDYEPASLVAKIEAERERTRAVAALDRERQREWAAQRNIQLAGLRERYPESAHLYADV